MQRRMNPREARRMMQRMGMSMDNVQDVTKVIIKTTSRDIIIEQPEVSILNMQGQKIFQVAGGTITERTPERVTPTLTIPEEDIQLVAEQTGKSINEARKALEECEGDLAKAILLLQS